MIIVLFFMIMDSLRKAFIAAPSCSLLAIDNSTNMSYLTFLMALIYASSNTILIHILLINYKIKNDCRLGS